MRRKRDLPYRCDLSVSDWLTTITSVGNMQSRMTAQKAGVINKAARKVPTQCNNIVTTGPISVPHPDLEISGGGGGIQTRRYVGGRSPKHFFRPFGPQFGLKMRGGRASPLNPPLNLTKKRLKRWLCSHLVSRHSTRVRCSRRVQGDIWVWTHRFFVSNPDQNSGAVRVQGRDHVQPQQHDFQLALMSTQLHACLHL